MAQQQRPVRLGVTTFVVSMLGIFISSTPVAAFLTPPSSASSLSSWRTSASSCPSFRIPLKPVPLLPPSSFPAPVFEQQQRQRHSSQKKGKDRLYASPSPPQDDPDINSNALDQLKQTLKGKEPPTVYVQTNAEGQRTRIPLPAGPNKLLILFSIVTAMALGALGIFVGNFVGVKPMAIMSLTPPAFVTGLILALPLFAVDAVLQGFQEDTASEVYSLSIFGTKTPLPLVLALAASVTLATGIGEEILFRGLIQQGLSNVLGSWPGLLVASLVFGAAHKLGPSDLAFITISGGYMGTTLLLTGDLTVPLALHAAYDFLILMSAFFRARRRINPN